MSATYRIETKYAPNGPDDYVPWIARVYRLSDDRYVTHAWGSESSEAVRRAREWVAVREAGDHPNQTVYVDDLGRDAEAPQSVKV